MFFYALLFVGSVIAALIILYAYNAVLRVGKSVYKARLPGSGENLTSHLDNKSVNGAQTPWGWGSHATPANSARTHPASPNRQAPWGWRGSEQEVRSRDSATPASTANATGFDAFLKNNTDASGSQAAQKPTVSWPYREDKSEAAGRVYKVTRKSRLAKTNLKNTATPWGW